MKDHLKVLQPKNLPRQFMIKQDLSIRFHWCTGLKKILPLFFLLFSLHTLPVEAKPKRSAGASRFSLKDCNFSLCDNHFELGGSAIYWSLRNSGRLYATTQADNPNPPFGLAGINQVFYNQYYNYDWGFQIWGAWQDEVIFCNLATVKYTYYRGSGGFRLNNPVADIGGFFFIPLVVTTVTQNFVKPIYKISYDRVFGRYTHALTHNGCRGLFFYVGGNYIRMKIHSEWITSGDGGLTKSQETDSTEGGALDLGMQFTRSLPRCFRLNGDLGFLALFADLARSSRNTLFETETTSFVNSDSRAKLIGGAQLDLSLSYDYQFTRKCTCLQLSASLGYHADFYRQAMRVADKFTVSPAFENIQNFLIGGPYLSAQLTY